MKRLLFVLPLLLWCAAAHALPDVVRAPDATAPSPVDASVASGVVNSDSTDEPPATDASAPVVVVTDVSVGPKTEAVAAPPPEPGKPLGEAVGGFIQAIKGGNWTLIIAFGLMILIWVIRVVWKAFPAKYTPWIAAGVAMVGALAVALINGEDILNAVHAGLLVAVSSGGLFSLINTVKKVKKDSTS